MADQGFIILVGRQNLKVVAHEDAIPTSATQKGIHNHQNTGFTSRWAVEEGWRAASLTELDFFLQTLRCVGRTEGGGTQRRKILDSGPATVAAWPPEWGFGSGSFGSQSVPVWLVFIARARRSGNLLTHQPWVADPGRGAERLAGRLFGPWTGCVKADLEPLS